jgi:glycosyltransferase involved in cell wall biosynthesis
VLLQAWRLVQKQSPLARLIIVGSGPLQAQFERMAQELDIAGSVEFAGMQRDIILQLNRGRIAVLPSRWEGMPVALLEAMACGLGCVATRVSGSEDIIQHNVNGFLIGTEDYQGMSKALLALLMQPELVKEFGNNARVTIEKQYSLDHITDSYIELYRRIISSKFQVTEDLSSSDFPRSSVLYK